MSQVELARRAGVTQSVVSAYESGNRQPSVPMLARLLDATGFELDLRIRRASTRLRRLTGPIGQKVKQRRAALVATAGRYGVTKLRVFGSVARGEDTTDSDVDLLVDLPSTMGLLAMGRLQRELEAVLGVKVDLVPAGDLKPAVAETVRPELVPL